MTASVQDVATQLGRPIDDPLEINQITAWLELADMTIRSRCPNLDQLIASGRIRLDAVNMVEASAVARHSRNPEGYTSRSEGIDDYTQTYGMSQRHRWHHVHRHGVGAAHPVRLRRSRSIHHHPGRKKEAMNEERHRKKRNQVERLKRQRDKLATQKRRHANRTRQHHDDSAGHIQGGKAMSKNTEPEGAGRTVRRAEREGEQRGPIRRRVHRRAGDRALRERRRRRSRIRADHSPHRARRQQPRPHRHRPGRPRHRTEGRGRPNRPDLGGSRRHPRHQTGRRHGRNGGRRQGCRLTSRATRSARPLRNRNGTCARSRNASRFRSSGPS